MKTISPHQTTVMSHRTNLITDFLSVIIYLNFDYLKIIPSILQLISINFCCNGIIIIKN